MTTTESGKRAEDLALKFLESKGYHLIERNYRFGRAEIDLIVANDELVVFAEVKMRTSTAFGHPEDFVDEAKAERLQDAAGHFCEDFGVEKQIRFDIIALLKQGKVYQIEHFEDAFF